MCPAIEIYQPDFNSFSSICDALIIYRQFWREALVAAELRRYKTAASRFRRGEIQFGV